LFGERQGECGLAAGGGSQDDYHQRLRSFGERGQWALQLMFCQ
jgi:hypothetical protein